MTPTVGLPPRRSYITFSHQRNCAASGEVSQGGGGGDQGATAPVAARLGGGGTAQEEPGNVKAGIYCGKASGGSGEGGYGCGSREAVRRLWLWGVCRVL